MKKIFLMALVSMTFVACSDSSSSSPNKSGGNLVVVNVADHKPQACPQISGNYTFEETSYDADGKNPKKYTVKESISTSFTMGGVILTEDYSANNGDIFSLTINGQTQKLSSTITYVGICNTANELLLSAFENKVLFTNLKISLLTNGDVLKTSTCVVDNNKCETKAVYLKNAQSHTKVSIPNRTNPNP